MKNFVQFSNKIGVLIANLGSPESPTPKALRKYLKEFLSDTRVVELPRWIWWFILHAFILRIRPRYSAQLYRKVWTDHGSALVFFSTKIAKGLQSRLDQTFPHQFHIKLAMRYGVPSITKGLEDLQKIGIEKLIILPLYPQYSGVSTGSVFDKVTQHLQTWRNLPSLHFINHYATHESYIAALANSIQQHWQETSPGEILLFSFHGIPQRNIKLGDPYENLCYQTAQAVAAKLKLHHQQWQVVFQSRVGRQKWLEPYCDVTLQELAHKGITSLDIICPGFAVDCLETLEEIQIRNKKIYQTAGGKTLNYIPALNNNPDHLTALMNIILSSVSTEKLFGLNNKGTLSTTEFH